MPEARFWLSDLGYQMYKARNSDAIDTVVNNSTRSLGDKCARCKGDFSAEKSAIFIIQ
jgi:hypothetical protein